MNDLPKEIYFSELIGSNGVNCLDYKNFDDSEKYIRGDIHEALEQRVGELEDWKKITDTAGKKLAEDNIRLRKALENVRKAQGDCMCHHVQGKCIKCIADEALKEV